MWWQDSQVLPPLLYFLSTFCILCKEQQFALQECSDSAGKDGNILFKSLVETWIVDSGLRWGFENGLCQLESSEFIGPSLPCGCSLFNWIVIREYTVIPAQFIVTFPKCNMIRFRQNGALNGSRSVHVRIQFVPSLAGHKRTHFWKSVTLAGTQSIWLEEDDYRPD